MIIRGVFSMSILDRLKSLFRGKDNEKEDIPKDVSNTSEDVSVKPLDKDNVDESKNIEEALETTEEVIEEETSDEIVEKESVEPVVEVVEEKTSMESVKKDSEEEILEQTNDSEDVEDSKDEKNKDENSINKDEKRDNMTLLTDKELLNDSHRDPDFTAEFIDAGIETVKHCFQCGTCSGSCPSGRRTPYKVRQIIRKCLLGLKEEVITDDALWMCTTCYTCQERCPRSVKIVEIIKKARNIAAHAGYMAKGHKMTGVFVMNTGHAVPINDKVRALRTKIGLSELPSTTHSFPEALKEVQTLCKVTAFDELIGYDEATGGLKE